MCPDVLPGHHGGIQECSMRVEGHLNNQIFLRRHLLAHICLLCAVGGAVPGRCPQKRSCLSLQNSMCSASGPSIAAPLWPGSCPARAASRAGSAWELLHGELRWGWQGAVQLLWEERVHRSLWLERAFNPRQAGRAAILVGMVTGGNKVL